LQEDEATREERWEEEGKERTNRIGVRVTLHYVLELRPEVVDGFDTVSDLGDVLDVAVELVDGGNALAEILREVKTTKRVRIEGTARLSSALCAQVNHGATENSQDAFRRAPSPFKQILFARADITSFYARRESRTRWRTSAISATSLSRSRSNSVLSAIGVGEFRWGGGKGEERTGRAGTETVG
jgi:hypothetical protein